MSGPFNENNPPVKNINNMRKMLHLDFSNGKKLDANAVLSSPDLNMLKVGTPELEKMILANGSLNTPTPSILYPPKPVTEAQESFVNGFENALKILQNTNSQASNSSSVYELDGPNLQYFEAVVKEEPQIVPCVSGGSPPMSPVDMEYQERIKLERKRQRNRLAASKCRSRKLERISKLEDKVKLLKADNVELGSMINQLKEHVGMLKLEFVNHCNAGCSFNNVL